MGTYAQIDPSISLARIIARFDAYLGMKAGVQERETEVAKIKAKEADLIYFSPSGKELVRYKLRWTEFVDGSF